MSRDGGRYRLLACSARTGWPDIGTYDARASRHWVQTPHVEASEAEGGSYSVLRGGNEDDDSSMQRWKRLERE